MVYAYKIADCLDTVVGVTDPDTAANKAATAHCLEKVSLNVHYIPQNHRQLMNTLFLLNFNRQPDGPPAALRQIIYGYIQQVRLALLASRM